ncbi:hypothetical protein N7478_008796 [Penicillium angulare]|uniref:uncharacterized protein n=1 Tax=Penicillium angulare TaxID=116970 RepID=UPI00253FA8A7|nr:uncharacterized protein N7478_008796 [Penicillium angulare]KAJ5273671.1 hypothetical protein N7478_008796 [Penicillium angulare]
MASESLQDTFARRADELREYIFSQPASNFENNPWALAAAIETFANEKGHMMIFRDSKLAVAKEALLSQQPAPRTILEFGTFVGKSALAWGAILRDIYGENIPEDVNVYTFDPDSKMVALTRDFVKLAGMENVIHVLEGFGSDSLNKLVTEGKVTSVDMAFYDHWEKYYLSDLQLLEELKLWRVGSLAIADNTDMPGAPDYLAYVKAGGSGASGAVKYESKSYETQGGKGPNTFTSSSHAKLIIMTVFFLIIINKAGGLIYQREFQPGLRKLSTNDYLVLAGTFHGVHAITRTITPRLPLQNTTSPVVASPGTNAPTTSGYSYPNPGVPASGLEYLETEKFRLTCFQTLTGTKFLLFTDPMTGSVETVMNKIYELYADYVMKNPFYQLEMPVRCEAFDRHLAAWLRGRT